MNRIRTRTSRPPFLKDRLTLGLMVAFVVVAIAIAVVAFRLVRDFVNGWTLTSLPGISLSSAEQTAAAPNSTVDGTPAAPPAGPLQSSTGPTPQPWDGTSRVNVLVMGLDFRDWEAGEIPRTDTMMLLTMDPVSKTAGMLSIPRDMWVNIPGFDYGKINTAYFLGESFKLPGGGPGLAVKTVEEFLGVPINYYAQIDFGAFESFIDHIQGVKLTIEKQIKIDPIGKWNTVILEPGRITLNGKLALAYARARYTEGGDFDRGERQRQVVMAIRDRIVDFNQMPNLIANAPLLYKDLSSGIHTNLDLNQVIQLALFAIQIDKKSIKQGGISTDMVTFGTSPDGLDILKPIPDKIRILRDQIFTTGGPVSPAASQSSDPLVLAKEEKASLSVQNASHTAGLAARTSSYFKTLGLNPVEETNAEQNRYSGIIVYSSKPYTAAYLVKALSIPANRIFTKYDPNATVDIAVMLGDDWASKNPMP